MGNLESNPSQHRLVIERREVELVRKLGEGGYSFVFLVQDVSTGQRFALKRILAHDKESAKLVQTEIDIMVLLLFFRSIHACDNNRDN
jgi:serine/threonine protein kinase